MPKFRVRCCLSLTPQPCLNSIFLVVFKRLQPVFKHTVDRLKATVFSISPYLQQLSDNFILNLRHIFQ